MEHLPSVDTMRPVVLRIIHHVRFGIGDKAESTWPLGLGVLHNNDINNFPPFFKVCLQWFISGAIVQPTNKDLAVHLGLVLKVGRRSVNKMADSVVFLHPRRHFMGGIHIIYMRQNKNVQSNWVMNEQKIYKNSCTIKLIGLEKFLLTKPSSPFCGLIL